MTLNAMPPRVTSDESGRDGFDGVGRNSGRKAATLGGARCHPATTSLLVGRGENDRRPVWLALTQEKQAPRRAGVGLWLITSAERRTYVSL